MKKTSWHSRARKLAGGVLPMLLASPYGEAGEPRDVAGANHPRHAPAAIHPAPRIGPATQHHHLQPQSRLVDLLDHPAFNGFSRRMLPWDDQVYDEKMRLADIGQLLPYHSHVDIDVVLAGLNRMVDDVDAGRTVFYDIYTAEERLSDPALNHTGLFFFRGKPGAPFAVIAPGGGFAYVGSVHEGFPYADLISRNGFNAFVLKYRTGQGGRTATRDLAAAVAYIFRHADRLQVDTRGYSLWGSSAGARMAASIGSHGTAAFGQAPLPKPAMTAIAYTGHSEVMAEEPATFVVVGEQDGIAPPAVMEKRVAALRLTGATVAYRAYPALGHGFGTGQGTSAQGWIDKAVQFWKRTIGQTP